MNTPVTLDPTDWDKFKETAHAMLEDIIDNHKNIADKPVWQAVPENVKDFFKQPLPEQPSDLETTYAEFLENILQYPLGNTHPRFWGWCVGTGTLSGMMADMLASAMNPSCGGGDHAANYVEDQVLNWTKAMLRYPETAGGLLVSGTAMASLISLTVARNTHSTSDIKQQGFNAEAQALVIYASEQTHRTIHRAVEILGIGLAHLRIIPVNEHHQINLKALEAAIAYDLSQNRRPFCVVGNAGTTTIGAFDNLTEIAGICKKHNLWFHIDGAFGALTRLSDKYSHLTNGLELADSVALDFHKWMYMPYEIGCVLIKDAAAYHATFQIWHPYLPNSKSGMTAGAFWPGDYGIELSRNFKALKAWFLIKEHGIQKFSQLIENNIAHAHYLINLIQNHPELELIAPAPLNIVCFRFINPKMDEDELNTLNHAITYTLQESGKAVISDIIIQGKTGIRAAFFNYKSTQADLDFLINSILMIGKSKCIEFLKKTRV